MEERTVHDNKKKKNNNKRRKGRKTESKILNFNAAIK